MSARGRAAGIAIAIVAFLGISLLIAFRISDESKPAGPPKTDLVRIHGWFDNLGLGGGSASCVQGGEQVVITTRERHIAATATLPAAGQQEKIRGVTAIRYAWSAQVPVAPGYGVTAGSLPPYEATLRELEKGLELSC